MNNKFLLLALTVISALTATVALIFWGAEARKNAILRNENVKTLQEVQRELETSRVEMKQTTDVHLQEKNKLMVQIEELTLEKGRADEQVAKLKSEMSLDQDLCQSASDDVDKLNKELARVRKERAEIAGKLETGFRKQKTNYDTKILSLESQLEKAKNRLNQEAERYHYNLGVVATRNKDYENAVEEFQKALAYNPNAAKAHYNLGIIYDDYFKNKEKARYHYRAFLELQPASDDAESVKEWLAELER